MADDEEVCAVVIDLGSHMTKAGFAGDDAPRSAEDTVVARPKSLKKEDWYNRREVFAGYDAVNRKGVRNLSYPIRKGEVTSWEDLELFLRHMYHNELRVAPEDHAAFITEAPLNQKVNRETMTELIFEKFNAPAFYLGNQSTLALYCSGRMTGVVLDSGHGVTHSVPIFDGYCMPHAIGRCELAGDSLTKYMLEIQNFGYDSSYVMDIARDVKEKRCYVAMHYDREVAALAQEKKSNAKTTQNVSDDEAEQIGPSCENPHANLPPPEYELPDGTIVKLTTQRVRVPEILFKPHLVGSADDDIATLILKSISKCDPDVHSELYSNVVLSGGSTMFEGISERLHLELLARSDAYPIKVGDSKLKIAASPERKYATWIGGSIIGSLSDFSSKCVFKADYEENGAVFIHRKCF